MAAVQYKSFSELKDPRFGSDDNQALKLLYFQGWMGKYDASSLYGNQVAGRVNPVLVSGLKSGSTRPEVESACKPFGEVKSVNIPAEQSFAFVTFSDDATAAKVIEGLKEVAGVPVKVQPAKMASKEVAAWRSSLRK
mmetsp:Transcript_20653/g.24820  ORF Transcript_20653/g.24820 Transcript_20653/m.24820 type:complete len:137 (-) Transcript_20653:135-545(-)|eukprot:CAMPEP_0197851104 /NCGR_PEP_ID=MMETSP1438-20131217/17264_1 /TAXON_ID=1461541 /ORGANISM="Pterosperma sp., Strain CCMP1384" /LENGTH=136 /DNA_ID=CAMNT_0043464585 /DNA_START=140 /DNA_END=550 /DNA_ORIENTATION=+